jgi:hypothetical protein
MKGKKRAVNWLKNFWAGLFAVPMFPLAIVFFIFRGSWIVSEVWLHKLERKVWD